MSQRTAAGCSSHSQATRRATRTAAALLLLLAPIGATFAAVPQPGTDVMRAAGSVEITVDGIGTDHVRLLGDISIVRHPPSPNTPDAIPIEIVSLNLIGFSPVFGRVGIQPCVLMASTGLTQRALPVESPSDSFFDVWFDIALPDRGLELTQGAYFRIEARTTAVPFFDVFTGRYSQMIPLVDDLSGMPRGSLTHVALDPNPRIDRLATQAQLDWTLGTVREVVALSGESLVVASDSWVQPGPISVPEFNTELVAMDLTGATPIHGPIQFHEQMQIQSPGRTVAIGPGPVQFPADSFFDVFLEISGVFSPGITGESSTSAPVEPGTDPTFYNASGGIQLQASISAWPAFDTPYINPGPINVPLLDRSNGRPVGSVNGLRWVWTGPAGGCVDADGDGVFAPPCGTDCDDHDPNNYPGNLESCADGRDNNCNQAIDCQDPLCLGRPCDDGDLCTQDDRCVQTPLGGICRGTPTNCDDNNPCTQDSCESATGLCRHIPQFDVPCDDGDACTQGDRCMQGPGGGVICQGAPPDCDDGNECTLDSCDPATGACKHDPLIGQTCDDGNDCTQDDRCVPLLGGGAGCRGTPVDCDDQNPCTQDTCLPSGCIVPDNGTGTATLPPQCPYLTDPQDPLQIIDGLPAGTTISIGAVHHSFSCPMGGGGTVCSFPLPIPGVDCDQPGGSLGGEQQCAGSTLSLNMTGTGALLGFNRLINLTMSLESHAAPRTPGDPVQSFDTDMFRLFGQISNPSAGDQDFDLLRIVGGTDFGLVGPGHTILTQHGGSWAVDSFFDITYRIDFIGKPGGALSGMSGSTTGTERFATRPGGCVHTPVHCDDGDPCTVDRCNPLTGACDHEPVNCDDGNDCTRDFCDPDSGACKHDPLVGQTCDDGNDCTQDDRCVASTPGGVTCRGTPVDCDDQNPCTQDSCLPSGCIVPDNGTGTATLPPQCPYLTDPSDPLHIIDGLPAGTSIDIGAVHHNFSCPMGGGTVCSFPPPIPGVDCDQPGGSLGGEEQCSDSILAMNMTGTGALAGFNRFLNIPVSFESHAATRTPGDPVQSFDTDMFRFFGQIVVDPDFDLLRIVGGTDFGLVGPGHTILSQVGGSWAVDSFFDFVYRIDFVGAPGGALAGMSGSTTGQARFATRPGGCIHTPVSCDDQNPCTFDSCDPATGLCVHVLNTCDDGDACTQDACNPNTGACEHRPVIVNEPDPIKFSDQVTVVWSATPDATHWNTYRGSIPRALLGSRLPAAVYDQACYESDDAGGDGPTTAIDAANPSLGTAFYYLTSGENACGESDIGHPSPPGAVIPNTMACPTPP